jgi:hypothetical protein
MGEYAEGEEALLMVQSEQLQMNPIFLAHLARCCLSLVIVEQTHRRCRRQK